MANNGLAKLLYSVRSSLHKHSPEILLGVGIAGMVSTVVTAVKVTPKAMILLEEKKKELNTDELRKRDVIKAAWKCYIPSAVLGTLSVTCIIGANSINSKRNTALATAYSLSESALKLYQEKVIETIGEKEERKVRDAVAKEQINRDPVTRKEVIVTDNGSTLCYDVLSGRYFKSDIETLKRAVNILNRDMLSSFDNSISLNDFYNEIGLESTPTGECLGWNVNKGLVELSFSTQLTSTDIPCVVIDFKNRPEYNYAL